MEEENGMSEWYEVEKKDIAIDSFDSEVSFYVCNYDQGNIYLTLSFDQIKEIADEIAKIEKKRPKAVKP